MSYIGHGSILAFFQKHFQGSTISSFRSSEPLCGGKLQKILSVRVSYVASYNLRKIFVQSYY